MTEPEENTSCPLDPSWDKPPKDPPDMLFEASEPTVEELTERRKKRCDESWRPGDPGFGRGRL